MTPIYCVKETESCVLNSLKSSWKEFREHLNILKLQISIEGYSAKEAYFALKSRFSQNSLYFGNGVRNEVLH